MKNSYRICTDEVRGENGATLEVYGIEIWQDGKLVQTVRDIFTSKETALEFAALCERLELSPVQLEDLLNK